jgi:hypothetical protein
MHAALRWLGGATAATLVALGALPAWPETVDRLAQIQQQVGAGQLAPAEQAATQLIDDLAQTPDDPLIGRVYTTRADIRLKLGLTPGAVGDYLEAIQRAEGDQRRAAAYLELAAAMTRQGLGDHACAAIRQAVDAAPSEFTPLGRIALARSKELSCPSFADRDFATLFQLPFRAAATTEGTSLSPLFGGAVFVRLPNGWAIDETTRGAADGVDVVSSRQDGVCAIRRSDGPSTIKSFIDAAAKEDVVKGKRPNGVLADVDARESRIGPAQAIAIDFAVETQPGRLYIANRLDRTYTILCLGAKPESAPAVRQVAHTMAASMRWRP